MINHPYVQVGQGRLGRLIVNGAKSSNYISDIQLAEIDENIGLCHLEGAVLNGIVERLVICISPSVKKPWQWNDILKGLEKQVKKKQLVIGQLIFISSTRVYDGIDSGTITAETPAIAKSQAGLNLLKAEETLKRLAKNTHFLRCSGLFSDNLNIYQQYYQILLAATNPEKVRFALNVAQVVKKVINILTQTICHNYLNYYLLTDGYCHVNGKRLNITDPQVILLTKRLLKLSHCSLKS